MSEILNIIQQTKQKFLNMFEFTVKDRTGNIHPYYVASRAANIEDLKVKTGKNTADGVIIYAIHQGEEDRIVLIKQYRYSIGGYIYELPAGLIDEGESFREAAAREMKEETGLSFTAVEYEDFYSEPFFTTVGMTDESCHTVYGKAYGNPSADYLEANEEIEVVLADRELAKEIMKTQKLSVMAGYLLMNFIHNEDPFHFIK